VTAPGYRPLKLAAPSTVDQTFELRMERLGGHRPRPQPAHDAAPVQDL
jgi:hypothetical protein